MRPIDWDLTCNASSERCTELGGIVQVLHEEQMTVPEVMRKACKFVDVGTEAPDGDLDLDLDLDLWVHTLILAFNL
jgi:hypothetical protein